MFTWVDVLGTQSARRTHVLVRNESPPASGVRDESQCRPRHYASGRDPANVSLGGDGPGSPQLLPPPTPDRWSGRGVPESRARARDAGCARDQDVPAGPRVRAGQQELWRPEVRPWVFDAEAASWPERAATRASRARTGGRPPRSHGSALPAACAEGRAVSAQQYNRVFRSHVALMSN